MGRERVFGPAQRSVPAFGRVSAPAASVLPVTKHEAAKAGVGGPEHATDQWV